MVSNESSSQNKTLTIQNIEDGINRLTAIGHKKVKQGQKYENIRQRLKTIFCCLNVLWLTMWLLYHFKQEHLHSGVQSI